MKPPKRLASSGSSRARELLSAGRGYRPRGASRDALIGGLGLGGTVKVAAASGGIFATLAGKIVVGVAGGIVIAATGRLLATSVASHEPPVSEAPVVPALAPPLTSTTVGVAPSSTEPELPPEAPVVQVLPAAIPPAPQSARADTPPRVAAAAPRSALPSSSSAVAEPSAPAAAPSLATAIRVLDEARGRLAANRPREALALLDANRDALASSPLAAQATVVRVDAMRASGDAAGARRVGEAYLARSPSGPMADRIRAILGRDP